MKFKFGKLPETTGVYVFEKDKEFLYIGKAANIKERVKQHRKLSRLSRLTGHIGYVETDSETDALLLEAKLIKKYQPKYNVDWKDDKNYFYVGITKEPFPRVFITHQPSRPKSELKYIGPFVDGKKLKKILTELRKKFPYRTCKTLPSRKAGTRPCLWYHLKQCPAPCLFSGGRLEAYDISNIQGEEAAGSMVTFVNGKPDKNFYRRFKIKGAAEPNDVAMLKEVLERRLKHKEWPYPDLILVDGGRAQLNAAKSLSKIPVMALAKKRNELYVKGDKKPILLKNLPQEFSNFILRARDEAHRFARAYHHHLRDKRLLS